MFSTAKTIKNKSSAEKRVATSLLNMASEPSCAPADAAVLRKAASIVEARARKHTSEANAKKAAEEKWARDFAKAKALVEPAIREQLGNSTIDRITAAIAFDHYRVRNLRESICEAKTAKALARDLDYWANDGIQEMVYFAAGSIARGTRSVEDAISYVLGGADKARASHELITLAQSYDAAMARFAEQVSA